MQDKQNNKTNDQSHWSQNTPPDPGADMTPPPLSTEEVTPPMMGETPPPTNPPVMEEKENKKEKPEEPKTDDQINPSPADGTQKKSDTGSAAPENDIKTSNVVGDKKPKKKFGGGKGKYIATILGILLLVGGVGAGVVLVQQQQDIREKARECVTADCSVTYTPQTGGYNYDASRDTSRRDNSGSTENQQTYDNIIDTVESELETGGNRQENETCQVSETSSGVFTDNCGPGLTCHCQSGDNCPADQSRCESTTTISKEKCENQGRTWTINHMGYGMTCCEPGYVDNPNGDGCVPYTNNRDDSGGNGGSTTVTAKCLEIKAYDTEWNLLTTEKLSVLSAGNIVRFTVSGSASSGTFTKARFTINGVQRPEVTTKKPSSEEYYDEYTIPESTVAFSVSAQIYHDSLGWK